MFSPLPAGWELIQEQAKLRRLDCPYGFHCHVKRTGEFRKSWRNACIAAGLGRMEEEPHSKKKKYVGTIVHDLRRCAARNLSRAGVQEAVAMEITGTQDSEHVSALPHRRRKGSSTGDGSP